MKRFGKGWRNLDGVELVPTPVGMECFYCPVKFVEGDLGIIMPYSAGRVGVDATETEVAVHRTCMFKACGIGPDGAPTP